MFGSSRHNEEITSMTSAFGFGKSLSPLGPSVAAAYGYEICFIFCETGE
jgi:hypothetical protein